MLILYWQTYWYQREPFFETASTSLFPARFLSLSLFLSSSFFPRVFTSAALTSFTYFHAEPPGAFHIPTRPAHGIKKHQDADSSFLLRHSSGLLSRRAEDEDVTGLSSSRLLPPAIRSLRGVLHRRNLLFDAASREKERDKEISPSSLLSLVLDVPFYPPPFIIHPASALG